MSRFYNKPECTEKIKIKKTIGSGRPGLGRGGLCRSNLNKCRATICGRDHCRR